MNLRLTAAEKAILQKYYCNSIGLFQYDAFCEDIDEGKRVLAQAAAAAMTW